MNDLCDGAKKGVEDDVGIDLNSPSFGPFAGAIPTVSEAFRRPAQTGKLDARRLLTVASSPIRLRVLGNRAKYRVWGRPAAACVSQDGPAGRPSGTSLALGHGRAQE